MSEKCFKYTSSSLTASKICLAIQKWFVVENEKEFSRGFEYVLDFSEKIRGLSTGCFEKTFRNDYACILSSILSNWEADVIQGGPSSGLPPSFLHKKKGCIDYKKRKWEQFHWPYPSQTFGRIVQRGSSLVSSFSFRPSFLPVSGPSFDFWVFHRWCWTFDFWWGSLPPSASVNPRPLRVASASICSDLRGKCLHVKSQREISKVLAFRQCGRRKREMPGQISNLL